MRFIIWVVIANFLAPALATCGTCSLSGDQHFITLDGAQHHYNGRGWHRLFQIDRFEVQCLFADCKTGAETIDGHRRRNDARRICLQGCRARFSPDSICPQIVNWEPLQVNGEGQSLIEVNGARLQSNKGVSQADKNQTWWLRIERVGKDAVAMDVMMGGGAGGVALRLGPKRIITVTVRGLEGGRGLCGSCDNSTTNDLAGSSHLNVSDIEGHNRFADPHRRGSAGFALIPVKPECAGGSPIHEQEETEKLLKAAEEAQAEEEHIHQSNARLAALGSTTFRSGAPDYDANLIVPPVATFANETLLDDIIHDCRAGMVLSADDERMKMAIDNCVLDKARGRGFELAAASNIIAYVQALMIAEQADLALHRLPLHKNFCAMCQSAIQTFVVDTKPILRHVVEKQAHWFDPHVAVYTALVPAPFEMIEPDPTPMPTPPPLPMPVLAGFGPPRPTNESAPSLPSNSVSGPSDSPPSTSANSSLAAPPKANSTSGGESPKPPDQKTESDHADENGHKGHDAEGSDSNDSKSKDAEPKKAKKKSKSDVDSDSEKYHLIGSKPISNEDEEYDDDEEESTKKHHHENSNGSHTKEKHSSRKDSDEEDSDERDEHNKKATPTPAPTPPPTPAKTPAPPTPAPTPLRTKAPILPGSSPAPEETITDLINNLAPILVPEAGTALSNTSNETYPTVRAKAVRI